MTTFRGANPFDQLTPGVKGLLIANVGVFFLQMIVPGKLVELFALTPSLVIHKFWIWQVFTYAFLHGSFWHIFFNMFALWMFASHIEAMWGTRKFLTYYVACVLGAALTQFIAAPNQLMLGASGGIYGLLIAFGLLFPDAIIYLFFFFPLRAIQAVLFIAVLTFVSAIGPGGAQIAHFAHLGGLVTGFLYLKFPIWLETYRSKRATQRFEVIYPDKKEDDLSTEVDRILDKISAKGVDSLTPAERKIMERYAREKK
jgi:membrane associated rhomboid family serine protease